MKAGDGAGGRKPATARLQRVDFGDLSASLGGRTMLKEKQTRYKTEGQLVETVFDVRCPRARNTRQIPDMGAEGRKSSR
ncbi:hypothetical protein ABIB85_007897 [Bradyrhizobium sp. JR1.5]